MSFTRRHDFLVAIDSDGCVFDTVGIKVRECFVPELVRCWGLQPAARFARAAAEHVFIESHTRGINRFPGLVRTLQGLAAWPAVRRRCVNLPDPAPLAEWVSGASSLSNASLEAEVARAGHAILSRTLDWSRAANEQITRIVYGIPPFPMVRESLAELASFADLFVCSTTPTEAITREWKEHGIDGYVQTIQGQEYGPKGAQIAAVMEQGGYEASRLLMLGDAPGDLHAVRVNGGAFFPIRPGAEDESWEDFLRHGIGLFARARYGGDEESGRVRMFEALLSAPAPWQ